MPGSAPFVLLDDARPGGTAWLYQDPADIVTGEWAGITPALRTALATGRHAAGCLDYEGQGWFGLFERRIAFDIGDLPDPAGAFCGAPEPLIDYPAYAAMLDRAQALIAAGQVYQLNLTFSNEATVGGHPLALYARLRAQAGAGWGAVVFDGTRWILSFSPELFFTVEGRRIIARPMKGTSRRGRDAGEDDALAGALSADPKQRAENLMIVDLLRNDMSRVSRPGSVKVPELFVVERYPTVLQMVSGITGELAEGRDAIDALSALFPCGSIVGAPKLRAMRAIADIEGRPRGVYTGAIGALSPGGDAAFNVAIRTLVIDERDIERGARTARIGLGSGIVADSHAPDEWAECLAKGAFMRAGLPTFDLIETMRFDPMEGVLELERHLARLKASAEALGFAFDRHATRNELHAATFHQMAERRIRLRLARSGAIAIETAPMPLPPEQPVTVKIGPLPVDPNDVRLRHKTSDRGFYDRARLQAGAFELLFVDGDGFLTEGSFTSIFARRGDGVLVTPPLTRSILPGVLRDALIAEGDAVEGELRAEDLAGGFFIGNALRGLIAARLI